MADFVFGILLAVLGWCIFWYGLGILVGQWILRRDRQCERVMPLPAPNEFSFRQMREAMDAAYRDISQVTGMSVVERGIATTIAQIDEEMRTTAFGIGTLEGIAHTITMTGVPAPDIYPRNFHIDTVPGQTTYDLPANETPITRIDQAFVSIGNAAYALQCWGEEAVRGTVDEFRGVPTAFCYSPTVGTLSLWPTPDAVYRIGFTEMHGYRGAIGVDMARVTRNAFIPARGGIYAEVSGILPRDFDLEAELCLVTRAAFRHAHSFWPSEEQQAKAISLMEEWLTPEQLADWQKFNSFVVTGNATGKRYRIMKGNTSYNVRELKRNTFGYGEKEVASLCFVPDNARTTGDVMLAQKIMLEQNELTALSVANRHTGG